MSLIRIQYIRAAKGLGMCFAVMALAVVALAQGITTTTVQGTVYLANGSVGSGTLVLRWPAFTTAAGQSIAADSTTVTIAPDGFVSVNLAPNLGATPAGLFYTAVYYLSDGTSTTQYWVVPAASSATIAQVQAQVMPAAQAVQAVSKAYVDEAIAEASLSPLSASGGTLTGPLYLSGDPTQPLQAADKHYVDTTFRRGVAALGRRCHRIAHCPAAGRSLPGRSISRCGLRRQGTGLPQRHQLDLRRNLRCAQLQRQSLHGIEPYHRNGEHRDSASLRDDHHRQADHRHRRHA